MDIKKRLQDIYKFLTVGIWSVGKDDVPSMRFLFYSILKKLLLAIEFTTTKRITSAAAALTYICEAPSDFWLMVGPYMQAYLADQMDRETLASEIEAYFMDL